MSSSIGMGTASSRLPLSRISVWHRAVGLAILSLLLGASDGGPPRIEPVTDSGSDRGWAAYSASDYAGALIHYRKAAERNDALAQFNLAVTLVQGLGSAPRPQEGIARRTTSGCVPRVGYSVARLCRDTG